MALGQEELRSATLYFKQARDTALVHMDGLLDGTNTFTYPDSRSFQPMRKIAITNVGKETVFKPRLIINFKRNWFDIESIRAECFQGANTVKERALAVWKFMRDNRLHYYEPDYGREIDDPVKFLGVYGYGMCYNTSFAAASIASGFPYDGRAYAEFSPRNRHSVKDLKFDSTFVLLDPDIEVFYLKSDNKTLASYADVANDKHLIKRVHHYGKAVPYNIFNNYVADAVYEPTPALKFAGLYPSYHTLDFKLRPGESIEYSWEPAKYYHHFLPWASTHNAPMKNVGNGKFVYSTNFVNADLNELVNEYSGVATSEGDDAGPHIYPDSAGKTSSFVIAVESPFAIVNGKVWGNFYRSAADDELGISFSKDSITWKPVWTSRQTGVHEDSVELYELIQPTSSAATYRYYLKVDMMSVAELSCGIDSLQITSDFQVSRFFLPTLELGDNLVTYSDSNSTERQVAVEIEWEESSENAPPSRIEQPIFPVDQSVVDSLRFTFQWPVASDADGIVDYEFLLSDRPDMRFPLSPSFEVYTSLASGGGATASFSIPFDGMLNADSTYYWRVRAKDAKGAWGNWSPVWSFTPKGPMPPFLDEAVVEGDSITLRWDANPNGRVPAYYEIHASNEAFGFTPESSTLWDTTHSNRKRIPVTSTSPYTFYRVLAVDGNGSRSGPSNYSMIPYPFVYNFPDSIAPGQPYEMKLTTNTVYTTDMVYIGLVQVDIEEMVDVNVISKPEWITYNETDRTLVGIPDYAQAHQDSIIVQFTGLTTGYSNIQVFKPPVRPNSVPVLSNIDSVAYVGISYDQTIDVSDKDLPYGDHITKVEVVTKPEWMQAAFVEGDASLNIWGTPGVADAADTSLVVKAFDSANDSTQKEFTIRVAFHDRNGTNQVGILAIAPNPFGEEINVAYELAAPGDVQFSIFNSNGQKVYGISFPNEEAGKHIKQYYPGIRENGLYYLVMEVIDSSGAIRATSRKLIRLE